MADNTKRYIAVDLGTSCGKVVLATVSGGSLNTETVHSFSLPSVRISGQDYWDIYAAYSEILKGLTQVGSMKKPVESIGIDAWGPGLVCVAKDGSISGLPRLNGEVLSAAIQTKFFKRMARRELYEATGVNVLDSHAALQLFGLRREKSVALDNAKYLLFIPEAITYLLTGKRYTGFSSLSAAGLVDRKNRKVSRDVLSACKVRPKRFPSVVVSGTKLGKLTEEIADVTGLGRIPVVAVAGHDLASAVLALPQVPDVAAGGDSPASPAGELSSVHPAFGPYGSGDASAFLRIGAVTELGVETPSPIVNDQTFEMNFSNEAGGEGTNLLVKRIVGTNLLARCLAAWRAAGRAYSPEDVARMASEGAPTAAQLDPEDPALRSASDAPAAIARFCSLRSMKSPVDDAATVRLIYTSMAEKIGDTFIKLQSVTPFRLRSLNLIGDGLDPVFFQMVADECAVPVTVIPADAAVLGNILVQSGTGQTGLTRKDLAATYTPVTYKPGLH